MRKICILFLVLLFASGVFARGYSYHGYSGGGSKSYGYSPKYSSRTGSTHNVRPYIKKDGTYVQGHRAGNPRSGVHCKNNVCY